jgi:hypothetical protein
VKGKKRSTKKKPGRPATGQDPVTAVRLPPELLAELDLWRPAYPDVRSRSDFIRSMIIDGLNAAKRRQKRRARDYEDGTRTRLTAGGAVFTADRERQFTEVIKDRMLYEGACDLPWPEYVAFRKKHSCKPLTDSDLAYLAEWTPCAVNPKARR